MSSDQVPHWEIIEHGWRAVVLYSRPSGQWTAYITYITAPYWRIWAGCLFKELAEAQTWCREEIATQIKRSDGVPFVTEWHSEPPAWRWLWDTLSNELSQERVKEIRAELARRLHEEEEQVSP